MLKAAVIGIGVMGKNHVRVVNSLENVELVALADSDEELLKETAEQYDVKSFSDYKELLNNEELDMVSVVVPTKLHKEVALAAIEKGLHVLIEKPIALDEKDAEEIITAAKKKNVKIMIGHIERFNPAVIELRKHLKDAGEIYKIDVQRIGPYPGRVTDIGVITDLSVHDLDIITFLLNEMPVRIYAETQQKIHTKEDSVVALLTYPNELVAVLNINFISPTKIRQLNIFGTKGMFRVDYLNQTLKFVQNPSYSDDMEKNGSAWKVSEGKTTDIEVNKKEPLLAEYEAFADSIINNNPSPCSGEDGLTALKLANMLKKSADEKRILEL